MNAAMIVTEDGGYLVPPCPSWCRRPAGHDVDEVTAKDFDGALNRSHETEPIGGRGEVTISWTEFVGPADDAVMSLPQILVVDVEWLTTGEARSLARALLVAADRLDHINAVAAL